MKKFFKQIFCDHEFQEELRYYKVKYATCPTTLTTDKYVAVYKKFKCSKCSKENIKHLCTYDCMMQETLQCIRQKLEENGFIDYKDYLLK